MTAGSATFGDLLRRHRLAAGLTQEELAERAQVSPRAISDLERGLRTRPWRDTIQFLADALKLGVPERAELELAARRPGTPSADPPHRDLSLDVALTETSSPSVVVANPPTTPISHLPAQRTAFIGRADEVDAVRRLLLQPDVCLVTLIGPGGVGKTRLAIEIATGLLGAFPDGVYFVPLDTVTDPAAVGATIAQALEIRESATRTLLERVCWFLGAKRCLLVLDNFEQVADAAPVVGQVLAACPAVKALVTSRSPLHAYGEHEFPVDPLDLPELSRLVRLDQVGRNDAVHLFVERARAVKPDFALTQENARTVAQICHRLDGLPLAIELAAARLRLFPPQALLARLEKRLPLLTGGPKDRSARQQTLRGALAWSYDLLDDGQKALFRRLGVFVGGCTFAAAEAVAGVSCIGLDVLGGIEALVEHSLLRQTELAGEPRFVMLETTREYALEQLTNSGETDATRDRHAAHVLTFVEALVRDFFQTGDFAPHIAGVLAEMANVRAALGWYEHRELAEAGLRVLFASHNVWDLVGPRSEGWSWYQRFLTMAETQSIAPELRRNVLYSAGSLALRLGDLETSQTFLQQSIDLSEMMKDAYWVLAGLSQLGWLLLDRNELAQAQAVLERGLTVARESTNAYVAPAFAARHATAVARTLILLGDAARIQGDDRRARTFYETSLTGGVELMVSWARRNLGYVALHEGNLTEGRSLLGKSLRGCEGLGTKLGIVECLAAFAAVAVARNDGERAARLLGAFQTALEDIGGTLYFGDRFEHAKTMASLHSTLPDDVIAAGFELGRAMTLEEAVGYALEPGEEWVIAEARQRPATPSSRLANFELGQAWPSPKHSEERA